MAKQTKVKDADVTLQTINRIVQDPAFFFFGALEDVLVKIRTFFNARAACIITQEKTGKNKNSAKVELYYADLLSSETSQDFSLNKEVVIHGTGPLGLAWGQSKTQKQYYKPDAIFKDGKEARELARACQLVGKNCGHTAKNVKNFLVCPLYRQLDHVSESAEFYDVIGYLWLFNKKIDEQYTPFDGSHKSVAQRFCASLSGALIRELAYKQALRETSEAIVEALDRRDSRNAKHSRRVAKYMQDISKKIFEKQSLEQFGFRHVQQSWYAGMLHDVGKIGTPDTVLYGVSKLSSSGKCYRKIHPHASVAIVEHIKGLGPDIIKAISQHHERYEGPGGYLCQSQGEEISILARILAVGDTYDSMRRTRIDWRGLSMLAAYSQLKRLSGTKFDPVVVEAFLDTSEFDQIKNLMIQRKDKANGPPKSTDVLIKDKNKNGNPRGNFLTTEYACTILNHEIGKGILGREDGKIECKTKKNRKKMIEEELWWCCCEGNFNKKDVIKRIKESICDYYGAEKASERANESELAFLHIRWPFSNTNVLPEVYEAIDRQAFERKILPVGMEQGVGIMAPRCSSAQAYGLAMEFHKVISEAYAIANKSQSVNEPISNPYIGVAYVPSKDIMGCKCIIGCAMVASKYASAAASDRPNAVVFFERHQLDEITESV